MDETHSTVTGQSVSCPIPLYLHLYLYFISTRASNFSSTSTPIFMYVYICIPILLYIISNQQLSISDEHAGAVFGSVPHIVQVDDYNEQLSFKVSTVRTGVALSVKYAQVVKLCK